MRQILRKQRKISAVFALISIYALGFLAPLLIIAQPVNASPVRSDVLSNWTFRYSNPNGISSITATPDSSLTGSSVTIFNRDNSAITSDEGEIDQTRTAYSADANTIFVDNCTLSARISIIGEETRTEPIRVAGSSNASSCPDTEEQQGGIKATLVIANINEVLQEKDVDPLVFLLSSDSSTVDTESTERIKQGEQVTDSRFTIQFNGVPAGPNYTLTVLTNGDEIARSSNVNVANGEVTDVDLRTEFNQDGTLDEADNSVEEPACSGLTLGIAICAILESLFWATRQFYEIIQSQLDVDPVIFSQEGPTANAFYGVWNSFRIVANILFIGILLLAITGQAFSWFFTPYELKKIIPRLVIGIILVQLSWYISGFLVDVFNILGGGVRALLLRPVADIPSFDFDFYDWMTNGIVGAILGYGSFSAVRVIGGLRGFAYILPIILLPILLFMFFSLLLVVARQLLIMMLIVASPVVFVMWILPGTDGIWKAWWNFMLRALMMYPLIVGFITIGELAGKMTVIGTDEVGPLQLAGIIAFFAPYFLIPYSFSLASGALAGIAGQMGNVRKNLDTRLFGGDHDEGSFRSKGRNYRKVNSDQRYSTARFENNAFREELKRRSFQGSATSPSIGKRVGIARSQRTLRRKLAGEGRSDAEINAIMSDQKKMDMNKSSRSMLSKTAALGSMMVGSAVGRRGGVKGDGSWGALRTLRAIGSAPKVSLQTALGNSWETRLGTQTQDAKKVMDMLTSFGTDFYVEALFGDTDRYGAPLSQAAINMAKPYRNNYAVLNAGLKYLFSRPGSSEHKQAMVNKFATYNPYAQDADSVDVISGEKKAKKGYLAAYQQYEDQKIGTWKGATFGTQKLTRDSRFRDFKQSKRGEYDPVTKTYKVQKSEAQQGEKKANYGRIVESQFTEYLAEFNVNVPYAALSSSAPDYFDGIKEISEHIYNLEKQGAEPEQAFRVGAGKGLKGNKLFKDRSGRTVNEDGYLVTSNGKVDTSSGSPVRGDGFAIKQSAVDTVKEQLKMAREGMLESLNSATGLETEGGDDGDDLFSRERKTRVAWNDARKIDVVDMNGNKTGQSRSEIEDAVEELIQKKRAGAQKNVRPGVKADTPTGFNRPIAEVRKEAELEVKRDRIGQILEDARSNFAPQTKQAIDNMIEHLNWIDE